MGAQGKHDLRGRAWDLLCREAPTPTPPTFPRGAPSLFEPPTREQRFLPLLPSHHREALRLAAEYMERANARPGEEGLAQVLEHAEHQARQGDLEWVRYALRVFLTHHPEGQQLPQPSLSERAPHLLLPSQRTRPLPKGPPLTTGAEVWLDYFREDTGLNSFLDTWHIQYPTEGAPEAASPRRRHRPSDRGERFWFTHQQLLARYDTERLAFGMPRTVPLGDYAAPIPEGYDAQLPGFAPREPGVSLVGLPGYDLADHATRRDRLCAAASSGLLWSQAGPLDFERLGQLVDTLESNPGSVDGEAWSEPLGPHGAFHHLGQLLLACQGSAHVHTGLPGVLASPATAARDPLFYRWHRHVDDILDAWQSHHLSPHALTEGPAVFVRKWLGDRTAPAHQSPDILVCLHRDIPGVDAPDFDGQRWGEATFGGEAWTSPPPAFRASTQSLYTRMTHHPVRLPDGREVLKPQLDHEPFHLLLRVENRLEREQQVGVRIYLAADAYAEDRRQWLELDAFVHTLRPSERAVLFRPARLSAVVRERGWPLNLLLPRGRHEGMLFRFMVLFTDAQREPEWGFPFNRPLPPGQRIADLSALPHVATRNLWVHHLEP